MVKHRGSDLVVMDDNWGVSLARKTHGLEVMSTARLVLEMVVAGALGEQEGFRVFDCATPGEGHAREVPVGPALAAQLE